MLKLQDLKPSCDVQTTFSSFVYFNYFIHNMEMDEIFSRLHGLAQDALEAVATYTDAQHRAYCEKSGTVYQKKQEELKVLRYSELYQEVKALNPTVDEQIRAITAAAMDENLDRRLLCLRIVEHLSNLLNINTPTVILFLSPPYCPHNTLKREVPDEAKLLNEISWLLETMGRELGEELKLLQFFPVITDSSYLKLDDPDRSLETLRQNFPDMEGHYKVPLDQMRRLNIPALNFGCRGKDAHKWTERVHKEYSFGKLPLILLRVLESYLIQD